MAETGNKAGKSGSKKMRKGVTYHVTVFAIDQAGNPSPIYPAGTFTP